MTDKIVALNMDQRLTFFEEIAPLDKEEAFSFLYHYVYGLLEDQEWYTVTLFLARMKRINRLITRIGYLADHQCLPFKDTRTLTLIRQEGQLVLAYGGEYPEEDRLDLCAALITRLLDQRTITLLFGQVMDHILAKIDSMDQDVFLEEK